MSDNSKKSNQERIKQITENTTLVTDIDQEPSAEAGTALEGDPYLSYATAVFDHAEELFKAGLIIGFPASKEAFAAEYANMLRDNGLSNARSVLADFAERSGYPTPQKLYQQLDTLSALRDCSLSYEMTTSILDPHFSVISSFGPTGKKEDGELFTGPTKVCKQLLAELRAGNVTAAQAREMNRQWNESSLPLGAPEALYLVDNAEYYHVQSTDAGFDYTVYDAASGRLKDGGQFSPEAVQRHISAETLIEAALIEAMTVQSCDGAAYQEAPIERLDRLREANELPTEPVKLDEYPMPDPAVPLDALKEEGCVDPSLLPLGRDRAKELFAEGFTVFVLKPKINHISMCLDEGDISDESSLVFALDKPEWEKSPEFQSAIQGYRLEHQAEREAAFLRYPDDAFAIYQLSRNDAQWRERAFMNLAHIREKGMEPTRDHYDLIYTGTKEQHPDVKGLEDAFRVFNVERPADFGGHSLSVSDIVALKNNGVITYHYCDSIGFKKIPEFQKPENYLKNAEMAMEDDFGMIDGIINNGPREQPPQQIDQGQDLPQPERHSLLEQLKTHQKDHEEQKNKTERQPREERSI